MSYRELMSPFRAGPCLCGATDCPSCGPAQGYRKQADNETDEAEQPNGGCEIWAELSDKARAAIAKAGGSQ